MKLIRPATGTPIVISSDAQWPSAVFETDAVGPHVWNWAVVWNTFKRSGTERTDSNVWDPVSAIVNSGGVLTVEAQAGTEIATITVTIRGTNPSGSELTDFLATQPNSDGFEKILQHETKGCHFRSTGEPTKSFDCGYGMCQLTTPAPTFEQIWNWKSNVLGGLALYASKRKAAVAYLGQGGRSFAEDQVTREAVCRWNGGHYHEWDGAAGRWVRPGSILCDSQTGNMGWDMTDPANAGKGEAELHRRDAASYSKPPAPGAHWRYSGVCYADRILG